MVELLKVGASTFIRSSSSFTAFGVLTSRLDQEPDLNLIQLFLNNCTNIYIDLLQGPHNWGATPLFYACQQNWCPLIEELLNRGANPLITDERNFVTSITVCAAKGHADALRIIFKLSKFEFNANDLGQPCNHAEQNNQSVTLKLLQDYATEKGWIISPLEETILLGPGTSPLAVQRVLPTRMGSAQLVATNPFAFLPLPRRRDPQAIEARGQNFTLQATNPAEPKNPELHASPKVSAKPKRRNIK